MQDHSEEINYGRDAINAFNLAFHTQTALMYYLEALSKFAAHGLSELDSFPQDDLSPLESKMLTSCTPYFSQPLHDVDFDRFIQSLVTTATKESWLAFTHGCLENKSNDVTDTAFLDKFEDTDERLEKREFCNSLQANLNEKFQAYSKLLFTNSGLNNVRLNALITECDEAIVKMMDHRLDLEVDLEKALKAQHKTEKLLQSPGLRTSIHLCASSPVVANISRSSTTASNAYDKVLEESRLSLSEQFNKPRTIEDFNKSLLDHKGSWLLHEAENPKTVNVLLTYLQTQDPTKVSAIHEQCDSENRTWTEVLHQGRPMLHHAIQEQDLDLSRTIVDVMSINNPDGYQETLRTQKNIDGKTALQLALDTFRDQPTDASREIVERLLLKDETSAFDRQTEKNETKRPSALLDLLRELIIEQQKQKLLELLKGYITKFFHYLKSLRYQTKDPQLNTALQEFHLMIDNISQQYTEDTDGKFQPIDENAIHDQIKQGYATSQHLKKATKYMPSFGQERKTAPNASLGTMEICSPCQELLSQEDFIGLYNSVREIENSSNKVAFFSNQLLCTHPGKASPIQNGPVEI